MGLVNLVIASIQIWSAAGVRAMQQLDMPLQGLGKWCEMFLIVEFLLHYQADRG